MWSGDFDSVMAVGLTWIGGWIAASILYRRHKGKPILSPTFPRAPFWERWRSGCSHKNIITRFGGASNCLWVAITGEALCVGPMFPFNLMFLPEIYCLEYRIPGSAIVSLEERSSFLSGNCVKIVYRDGNGEEQGFEITVRDLERFRPVMRALTGKTWG